LRRLRPRAVERAINPRDNWVNLLRVVGGVLQIFVLSGQMTD
jgi:hypothetical protein